MFWRFGAYNSASTLDAILDKPDATVEELLDESDLIQELKQNNSKLIEFLREEHVLERLLQYVTAAKVEPSEQSPQDAEEEEESTGVSALGFFGGRSKRPSRSKSVNKTDDDEDSKEEKQRLKYAYVSCEVLSSDVWSIAEALLDNPQSLRTFWEYIKQEPPLDAVQAAYFTKVNESLLDKKTEEMLEFFKTIDNVIPNMVQHVDCPVIMDLLLKIISLERSEGGQGIVDVRRDVRYLTLFINAVDDNDDDDGSDFEVTVGQKPTNICQWLQAQNLIPLLLARLSPEYPSATQTAAGDFLKAIITISANATAQDTNVIGPNELTRQLVSKDCIQTLITEMLRGGNPLTVGVGIVIEVIRKNNSDYDVENQIGPVPKSSDPIYLGTLLRAFAENVPNFMALIQKLPENGKKRELRVAFGDKIEPLGFDRFKTCELMAELLHCSNMALLNERGAEDDVRKRDAEREKLKAEGKLTPARNVEASVDNEYGTSVDSSGFHHARAPSSDSDSQEDIQRSDAANGADEEFVDINVSSSLGDEIKPSPNEQKTPAEIAGAERTEAEQPENPKAPQSPSKDAPPRSPTKTDPRFITEQADSPTSAGVTERLESVNLGHGDTEMTDSDQPEPAQPQTASDNGTAGASKAEGLSPHPEDTPPPLFSKRLASESVSADALVPSHRPDSQPQPEPVDPELQQQHEDSAVDVEDGLPYVTDTNGKPVVGDLLKIKFVENRVVPTILDFFFRFPWNNFLHNVVYDVVQQVFNGQMNRGYNRSVAIDLFDTGRVTERIIEGQQASDEAQTRSNMRLGYMGHLTLIAEEVVKFTERHPPELLSQSVLNNVMSQQWIDYVENVLAETRERDNAILGGVRPDMSVGPRQAVLNAVNAAQAFGGGGLSAGLAGNGSLGLDSTDLTTAGSSTSSGGYLFSGSSLLSGFNHGSSDEEDEEMDELAAEPSGEDLNQLSSTQHVESDQSQLEASQSDASIPPPLKFHPTRARRQFAARLAERQRQNQELEAGGGSDDPPSDPFADPADDDEDDELEDVAGRGEEPSAQSRKLSGRTEHFSSDDSIEGEDVGIVMRKSVRHGGTAGFASLGSLSGSHAPRPGMGEQGRDAQAGESEGVVGEIRDVFERLGIDVGDISGEGEEGLGLFGDRGTPESDEEVEMGSGGDEEVEREEEKQQGK